MRLAKLLGRAKRRSIQFVEHLTGDAPTVFRHACIMGLEDIVSKRTDCSLRDADRILVPRAACSDPALATADFLNHVLLFLGRLSFIFGSALFGIVVFRHLPELDRHIDLLLTIKRGAILLGCLFALFCASLEVERLGHAFEDRN